MEVAAETKPTGRQVATGKTTFKLLIATLAFAAATILVYQFRSSALLHIGDTFDGRPDQIPRPLRVKPAGNVKETETHAQECPAIQRIDLSRISDRRPPIPGTSLTEFTYSQLQMAMPMRITVWCESQTQAEIGCKLAFDRAAELVNVFSDYDRTSETRRLADCEIGHPVNVSDHLLHVLAFSEILNERSRGAFDPTASPVIRVWRTTRKKGKLPEPQTIKQLLQRVGFDKLNIDKKNKTVTLLANGMNFDFGGIAKGYIGDQVIAVLRENGIEIGCYEAGGDIVLSDPPPNTKGWSIDVGLDSHGTAKTIELMNCGVSTSGDSQQFVEIAGQRYSHVIDPRTGIGVTKGRTTFVIAPTGMQSDSLATVGCVLNEIEFQNVLDGYDNTIGWSQETGRTPLAID